MRYRLTEKRRHTLHRIGEEIAGFSIVMGFILFMGLLNGLIEVIP